MKGSPNDQPLFHSGGLVRILNYILNTVTHVPFLPKFICKFEFLMYLSDMKKKSRLKGALHELRCTEPADCSVGRQGWSSLSDPISGHFAWFHNSLDAP